MSDATSAVPNPDQKPQSMHLMLYVLGFVSVQFFFLVLTLVLASTPWFLTHDAYPGMQQAGYSSRVKHADCDIVLYGDSSALTGLDPDIVQGMTGLKACNLSEGATIQGVVGSRFPLDSYLKNNKRPRYLLAMYTPSIFRPYLNQFIDYQPEGVMYALQYDRGPDLYKELLRRRDWLMKFDLWAGRQIIKDFMNRYLPGRSSKPWVDTKAQRDSRHGIWPYPFPPETQCVRTVFHLKPEYFQRHADSVAEMRNLFGRDGTTVLLNVAPVPTCDTLQQAYREKSEGLHDNAFEALPISYFNEGDVHFSPDGSKYISIQVANQILELEKKRKAQQVTTGGNGERPE